MTKYIVDKLASELTQSQVSFDCLKIENASNIQLSSCNMLGIAYPIHSFNAPQIVVDFIKKLPEVNGMETFIIHTAGEDSKLNYSSSALLMKRLTRKGYNVFYDKLIEMPSNFICKYDTARVDRIIKAANENIPKIAQDIITRTPRNMRKNLASNILTFIGRTEWLGARLMGKTYYADSNCTLCGGCVSVCPKKNIEMRTNSIRFKWRCCICMRCVYQCPQRAISIRRPFRFILFDEWYNDNFER